MRLPLNSILYMFVFITAHLNVPAQEHESGDTAVANQLLKDARMLMEERNHEGALEKIEEAKSIYLQISGDHTREFAECLYLTSVGKYFNNEYEDAKVAADSSLSLQLNLPGDLSREVALTYTSLGAILVAQKSFEDAVQNLEKALEIYDVLQMVEHRDVAMCHYHLGVARVRQAKYDESKKHVNKALSIRLKLYGEQHREVADSYNSLGGIYYYQAKYDEAIKYWEKALAIRLNVLEPTDILITDMYYNLAILHNVKGNGEMAKEYLKKALQIQLDVLGATDSRVANSYYSLAEIFNKEGKYDLAKEYFEKALDIRLELKDQLTIAKSYHGLGIVYKNSGQYDQAIEYYNKGLTIRLAALGKFHPQVSTSYNNLGVVFFLQGKYDKAAQYYTQSLEIQLKVYGESHTWVATSYNNLGLVYKNQGDYEKAEEYYKKVLDILFKLVGNDHPGLIDTYTNLANVLYLQGNHYLAIENHKKALEMQTKYKGVDHPTTAQLYNNLGEIYYTLGNLEEAIRYQESALEIQLNTLGNIHPMVATTYTNLGKIYDAQQQFNLANQNYHSALEANAYSISGSLDRVRSIPILIQTLKEFGQTKKNQFITTQDTDHLLESKSHLQGAVALLDYISNSIGDHDKTELVREAHSVHDLAISTNFLLSQITGDQNEIEDAFVYSERSKVYLLYQSMIESEAQSFAGIPEKLLKQESTMRSEITLLEKDRQSHLFKGLAETDTTVLKISNHLFDLNEQYDFLKDRFEKEFPDYYRLKYDMSVAKIADVQEEMIEEDQSLLEYFVGDSAIYAFVINKNEFKVHQIIRDFPLEEWVRVFRKSVDKDHFQMMIGEYYDVATKLYDLLIRPIASELKNKVTIIPDGVLGYLPFEALLTEPVSRPNRWRSHKYFMREKQISYSYSATLLMQMQEKEHRNLEASGLVAFAPYYDSNENMLASLMRYADEKERAQLGTLPYSGEEVMGIREITLGDVFFDEEATEDQFAAIASDYNIIHLASHAVANDKAGDYSFLAFTEQKDSIENELLYVRDLYNLHLNADMVVLSACASGIGELKDGEGIISLTRGFTYAGAKSIITSLWSVADQSTKDQMILFYKNLSAGMPKDKALREARLMYIENLEREQSSLAHPFYWSAFIAVGDMSAIVFD